MFQTAYWITLTDLMIVCCYLSERSHDCFRACDTVFVVIVVKVTCLFPQQWADSMTVIVVERRRDERKHRLEHTAAATARLRDCCFAGEAEEVCSDNIMSESCKTAPSTSSLRPALPHRPSSLHPHWFECWVHFWRLLLQSFETIIGVHPSDYLQSPTFTERLPCNCSIIRKRTLILQVLILDILERLSWHH